MHFATILKNIFLLVSAPIFFHGAIAAAATVSGTVTYDTDDNGYKPPYEDLTIRVCGANSNTTVANDGTFTLNDVPSGNITLQLEENNGDRFIQNSKQLQIELTTTSVTGVTVNPQYHWKEISYPSVWGTTGYGTWKTQFISANVGFIFFRFSDSGVVRYELYRTLNGGQNWLKIFEKVDDNQDGILYPSQDLVFSFFDQNKGIILSAVKCLPCGRCGDGFFTTSDGGENWATASLPSPDMDASPSYDKYADRIAWSNSSNIIVGGRTGCSVAGYSSGFYDVIWESANSGTTWESKVSWEQQYGSCTGLGVSNNGSAVAFFTPYGLSAYERRWVHRSNDGTWDTVTDSPYVVNSGYGPADVPMVGNTSWIYSTEHTPEPMVKGMYQSEDAGLSWTYVNDNAPQYMDFATIDIGFALFGGSAYVTNDGGKNWLHQSTAGVGSCCHGNDIWTFDASNAIWNSHDTGKILSYTEEQAAQACGYYEKQTPWNIFFPAIIGNPKDR